MKITIIILLSITILLNFSEGQIKGSNHDEIKINEQLSEQSKQQQDPLKPNPKYEQRDRCDSKSCQSCYDQICVKCNDDYYLTSDFYCNSIDDFEDRGDSISVLIAIINIIFLLVLHHGWIMYSRKNMNNNQQNQEPQLNQQALQMLQNQNNNFNNNNNNNNNQNGFPQQMLIGPPSEFDTVSKKSTFEPNIYDEKNNMFGYNKNKSNQVPNYDIDNNNSNQLQQNIPSGLPISQNQGQFQSNFVPQFQPQQQQQQIQINQAEQKQNNQEVFVTSDLNGYLLTQAGQFSFPQFSFVHRIQHVTINIQILQSLFASLMYWVGRRGEGDDKTDDRKKFLFFGFLVYMIFYWLLTFLPPLVIKIFSFCFCLKQDPNGKYSRIFINILFYVAYIIMIVITTADLVMMTGFEAQVWIVLCISAWLIILFFDKRYVELLKKSRGGCFEGMIKFRKIDFSQIQIPQQNIQNINQVNQV